jgi:hypothetical protein
MPAVPPFQRLSGVLAIIAGLAAWSSLVLGLSAVDFQFEHFSDPLRLLALGSAAALRLRWSFFLSLFGAYLCLIPLFLWLGTMLRQPSPLHLRMYMLCGLLYLLLGAIGAAILAAVWPALITQYAAAPPEQHDILLVAFTTATTIAEDGFQGVIQNVAGSIWFVGIGSLLWTQRRLFAGFSYSLGLGLLITTLGTMLGYEVLSLIGLTVTILLVPLWSIWVGGVLIQAPLHREGT